MQVASTAQAKNITAVPEGFAPEGIAPACLDRNTLYLVEHAIPPNLDGLRIFAHLLYYATLDPKTSMQYSLFQATGETQDEALVLITSVEALSKTPDSPCGPETYLKVLLIFEALRILRRIFHRNYTEIRISLGKREIHLPTLLKALRQLHDGYRNKKVKQIAKKVARRLQSDEFSTYRASSQSARIAPELQPIAQIVTSLLGEHGVETVHVPRLATACTLIAQAFQTRRVAAKKGEFVGQLSYDSWESGEKMGDSLSLAGEFPDASTNPETKRKLPPLVQTGEFVDNESPISTKKRLSQVQCSRKKRPVPPKRGDGGAVFTMESPESVSTSTLLENLGESVPDVSVIDHLQDSIPFHKETAITDSESASVSVPVYRDPRPIEGIRTEAGALAARLDGSVTTRWFAKFIKLIQVFPPQVRRLAEIDTLYHSAFPDYRGRPKAPGAWFSKRCEEYAQPDGKVPDAVRLWAETDMDLTRIQYELQRGRPIPAAVLLPFEAEQEQEPDLAQHQDGSSPAVQAQSEAEPTWEDLRDARKEGLLQTRMDQGQAENLKRQILREGHGFGILAKVYRGDQEGEYVVVTDWDGNEEEWTNAAEWNRYFKEAKACFS